MHTNVRRSEVNLKSNGFHTISPFAGTIHALRAKYVRALSPAIIGACIYLSALAHTHTYIYTHQHGSFLMSRAFAFSYNYKCCTA